MSEELETLNKYFHEMELAQQTERVFQIEDCIRSLVNNLLSQIKASEEVNKDFLQNISGYYLVKPTEMKAGVVVERCLQPDGSSLWAIRTRGMCMNKNHMLVFEPSPSNRTEEFYKECRWASLDEAINFFWQPIYQDQKGS